MPVPLCAIVVISVQPAGLVTVAVASLSVSWATSKSARTAPGIGVIASEVAVALPVLTDLAPTMLMAANAGLTRIQNRMKQYRRANADKTTIPLISILIADHHYRLTLAATCRSTKAIEPGAAPGVFAVDTSRYRENT